MIARFHELAATELDESISYYETKAEGFGDRFLAEVRAAVLFIQDFPESSPVIEREVRRKVLVKYPYDLFYVVESAGVTILSIAHESRRPGLWRGRAQ